MGMLIFLVLLATWIAVDSSRVSQEWDWRRVGGPGNGTGVTNAPGGATTHGRLTTADADMISNEPPQSPYFSDWNRLVSGYGSQRCYKIPREMKLCHNIGYDLMVLPNSLDHESMNEVITQSEVWMTLVNLGCHDELERFLCSLYAPVCIKGYHDKLIQPCRDLCESVQAACLPTMITFGLGWPDIVKCSKFPQAPQELCIPPNKQKKNRCSGCVEKPTYESAIGRFCTADVVVRAKIVDLTPVSASSSPNRTNRIRISGRLGVFKQPEGVHLPVNLEFQMSCDCPIVKAAVTRSNGPGRWLLMGKLDASKKTVTVQHLSKPSRQNAGIKRALRDIRNHPSSLCKVDLMHPATSHPNLVSRTAVSPVRQGRPPSPPHPLAPNHQPPHPNNAQQRPPPTLNSNSDGKANGNNNHLSPEEKRRRKQMRRQQRQHTSSPASDRSVTPAVTVHKTMNDLPRSSVSPRPTYPSYYQANRSYPHSRV